MDPDSLPESAQAGFNPDGKTDAERAAMLNFLFNVFEAPVSPIFRPGPVNFRYAGLLGSANPNDIRTGFQMVVKEMFVEQNKWDPAAFIVCRRNPITLAAENSVWHVTAKHFNSEKTKDIFSMVTTLIAHQAQAVATVFASECWFAKLNPDDRKKYDQVRDHPDKEERLLFHLEHAEVEDRIEMWTAPITTPPGRNAKRSVGEFARTMQGGKVTGRFVGFLPKEDSTKAE